MSASLSSKDARTAPHSVGFTLFAIALVIVMAGLVMAYGLSALTGLRPSPAGVAAGQIEERTLIGRQLHIPAGWLRDAADKPKGFSSQIALSVVVPLGRNGGPTTVGIMLLPLSQVRPSASLLDGVYLHQFMPNELSGPPGLVGKPLYSTEGYENETVWYDALSQNPFVAKCAAAPVDGQPASCLRTVGLPGGIAAVYSFDADALSSWKSFDMVMGEVLGRIGALASAAG